MNGRYSGLKKAKGLTSAVADRVKAIRVGAPSFSPGLAVVQVGEDPASVVYVGKKHSMATQLGFAFQHIKLDAGASQAELITTLERLNADSSVHGVILQLPVSKHMDHQQAIDTIDPRKDVDGFNSVNIGRLHRSATCPENEPHFLSCTPKGVMKILADLEENHGFALRGKNAVVVGRSDIVGKPMAALLTHANCTVTIAHSQTTDLPGIIKKADLVVAACGQPEMVRGEWIKQGAVVIDVGINSVADKDGKNKLVGDVHFASAIENAMCVTPVPGGVGPLTVACLMENTLQGAEHAAAQARYPTRTLHTVVPTPSDIDIAQSVEPGCVSALAKAAGLLESEFTLYGNGMAKVHPTMARDRLANQPAGNYVCVTGITPTPLGEGKSTTLVGLAQALGGHLGKKAFACLRQPSQGPTFGIKGGAAGGGYAQVIPMEEFNLHMTGDIHAISAAHNLGAAALDARMFHESNQSDKSLFSRLQKKGVLPPALLRRLERLGIPGRTPAELSLEERSALVRLDVDPDTITWNRVVDCNDRFLRGITVGQGPAEKGFTRSTGFDITVASEIMAIMALATDAADMRQRLGRMVFGASRTGEAVTAEDLGVAGAQMLLMRDALQPTLMQTLEGTPVFVHAGPFANIAHGNSSVIADNIALKLVGSDGYVLTEAGFGADIGFEKFVHIKCRSSGLKPQAVVLCATVRALKMHGGGPAVKAGTPLSAEYTQENLELVRLGCANMNKHIANIRKFGVECVVAINAFSSDTPAELALVRQEALQAGAYDAVASTHHSHGGRGAVALAEAVIAACDAGKDNKLNYLYDVDASISSKIETIVKEVYGGDGIELLPKAQEQIARLTKQGFGHLPICMAKTQYSFSADAAAKNVPTGFTIPIREVRVSAGAGFVYPLVGTMPTLPGLPTRPAFFDIDLDLKTGRALGLS